MSIRVASVVVAFVVTVAVPARAQGAGQPPPNYPQLAQQVASLQARVAKLEGNIDASDLAGTYSVMALSTTMTALHTGSPTVNATISTAAFRGTLTLNANGSFSYTHDGSETISDSFTYRANDGSANSNVAAVSITVTPGNDAPVAAADSYTVGEGGTLSPVAPGVLGNDTDADGGSLTAVKVTRSGATKRAICTATPEGDPHCKVHTVFAGHHHSRSQFSCAANHCKDYKADKCL